MKRDHVTFIGPPLDDQKLLEKLPSELAGLLEQINGFILFHGGLHVRGACKSPDWHSLRTAWRGEKAFHRLYPEMTPQDVPFAEDFLGDQFVLRDGQVWRLFAETGELECMEVSFGQFLDNVHADPVEFLGLQPLMQFREEGGSLKPGQLLSSYPPYCSEEAEDGVTLAATTCAERHRSLAKHAAHMRAEMGEDDFDD